MTEYEPLTYKKVQNLFLWIFLLSPIVLFVITFVISIFAKGLTNTINELMEFFSRDFDAIWAIGYSAVLAAMMTFIIVGSTLYHNFKWKQFFNSDIISPLRKFDFILTNEGLNGYYQNIQIGIRYYKWKDNENLSIHIFKSTNDNNPPLVVKNHQLDKDITIVDYSNSLVFDVNIKGRKRKSKLDIQRLLKNTIGYAKSNEYDLQKKNLLTFVA